MGTLLDAHVHLHDGFSVPSFLNSAAKNFNLAADRLSTRLSTSKPIVRVLAICALGDECPLARFREESHGWSVTSPDEHSLVLTSNESNGTLVLVAGRQVVTSEKLEVLSLFSSQPISQRKTLLETVKEVVAAEGVPVLPWGFGKWAFGRGQKLRSFLRSLDSDTPCNVLLGDNGCRWERWRSEVFAEAERSGIRVIAGSDPLPVASHVRRAGSFGSVLKNELDFENPVKWLRDELRQTDASPPTFGSCRSLLSLVSDQICVRLKKS